MALLDGLAVAGIVALLISMDVAAQLIMHKAKELEIIERRKQNNDIS